MSAVGNENDINDNINAHTIIFTIKDAKLYDPVVTLSARGNQNLSNLLSKGYERSVTEMNIKQEVRIKIQQMNLDIFSNQILLEPIDYLF